MSKNIPIIDFESTWLNNIGYRLDGFFYINDGVKFKIKINELKCKKLPLKEFLDKSFYPTRFKRVYIDSEKNTVPFISSSDMLEYDISNAKRLSKTKCDIDSLKLERGWILVSRSGTVGNVSYVHNNFEECAASEHIIRLIVKKDYAYSGYLYAYLNSKIGQNLLKSGTFGSVVDEIEPADIEKLPIIFLDEEKQKEIHNKILNVFEMRYKSNLLIEKSIESLYRELKLPSSLKKQFYLNNSEIKTWLVRDFAPFFRFEAQYYNPSFMEIEELLKSYPKKEEIKKIAHIGKVVNPPRGQRIYVSDNNGIAYYSGSDLSQFTEKGIKYLAKIHKQIEEVKIKQGWTLVTRVGTIGKVHFVDRLKDNKCASDNILRIIPDESKIVPEYLYLFLKSIYGVNQLDQIKTGSVQDYIPEEYIENSLIIVPEDRNIQIKISSNISEAFKLRNKAQELEEECSKIFDNLVFD